VGYYLFCFRTNFDKIWCRLGKTLEDELVYLMPTAKIISNLDSDRVDGDQILPDQRRSLRTYPTPAHTATLTPYLRAILDVHLPSVEKYCN
jgi:hypothetical protein